MSLDAKELLSKLTLEEKARLTSGKDNWFTKAVEHLGISSVRMSDGPHGLRTQSGDESSLAEGTSIPAVCFPAACATGSSFNKELLEEMGHALGKESQALGVHVLLGPGINMKRSPLCGRNFEYFSEDPYLAGELGTAFVKGVQSEGVGTSLKHFFANSQEHRRNDSSSEMDERTMREIYLPAFEKVVKEAQPWTVMASYNKVGGVFSTENRKYLQDVLREEWGFEGAVVSDWGATHNRVSAVEAGCDITMPSEPTDEQIVAAVKEGRLSEEALDACVFRILELVEKSVSNQKENIEFDYESGHKLARKIAGESMVLLKNEYQILPLDKKKKVAFLGDFAMHTRFQGGGSSHINSFKVTNAYDSAKEKGIDVCFAKGYSEDGMTDEELLAEAKKIAKESEATVVFAGLTDRMESEGVDRVHMGMPKGHNQLIEAVCEVQPNTIVVLYNGSPVEMPWVEKPAAILEAYLCGQAAGEAVVDILFGDINPSGHLAETFPKKLSDNPSYLSYFGEGGIVNYQEGIFMGYRYYETKEMDVLFTFGHGLSYTTFEYSNLLLDKSEMDEEDNLHVRVTVKNTGKCSGKAVVQLYVAPEKVEMIRPVRELKAFQKIELQPGESKELCFSLDSRAFAYWNSRVHGWMIENGNFAIQIGNSVKDICAEAFVKINAEPLPPIGGYKLEMPMNEFAKSKKGKVFLDDNIGYMIGGMAAMGFIPQALLDAIGYQPGMPISLELIDRVGQMAGGNREDVPSGSSALLNQPLMILNSFLPQEKKEDLSQLLQELNS